MLFIKKTRNRFLDVLLSATMLASSWAQVVYSGDELVGFALGVVRNDPARVFKPRYIVAIIGKMIRLLLLAGNDMHGIKDYLQVPKAYRSMRKGKNYAAEITLLAVSKNARGLGIGKGLVDNLIRYFKSMNAADLGVFTDSDSNYGFYDHLGFIKTDERELNRHGNGPGRGSRKRVFLYEYQVLSSFARV